MTSRTRSRTDSPRSRSPLPLILLGAAVVVAALIGAFVLTGDDDTDDTPDMAADGETVEFAPEPLEPTSVLPEPGTGPDRAVGEPAPVVEGVSFDGSPVTIGDPDQPTLVVFLAHWCPHCQREVPRLVEWIESGAAPDGLDVKAVATATDPERGNFPPSEWLEREGLDVEVLVDDRDSTAAAAYGLTGFPFYVLIGSDGEVIARGSGELDPGQLDQLAALAGA